MRPYRINDSSLAMLLAVMDFDDHLILSAEQAEAYGCLHADQLPIEEEEDYGE